jgi:hypothetical protein
MSRIETQTTVALVVLHRQVGEFLNTILGMQKSIGRDVT